MTRHELKTWPDYFWPVVHRQKTFEVRKADRPFERGDELLLRCWDPDQGRYIGAEIIMFVTYVLADFPGIAPGYVVLGISDRRR